MSITKLTGGENVTKYAYWLGPVGPTDKKNQAEMQKVLFQVHYLFETTRVWIRIRVKQPDLDPYKIEKQDPDPYQCEKQNPDPYQKGLDRNTSFQEK